MRRHVKIIPLSLMVQLFLYWSRFWESPTCKLTRNKTTCRNTSTHTRACAPRDRANSGQQKKIALLWTHHAAHRRNWIIAAVFWNPRVDMFCVVEHPPDNQCRPMPDHVGCSAEQASLSTSLPSHDPVHGSVHWSRLLHYTLALFILLYYILHYITLCYLTLIFFLVVLPCQPRHILVFNFCTWVGIEARSPPPRPMFLPLRYPPRQLSVRWIMLIWQLP